MRLLKLFEYYRENKLNATLKETIYLNRDAILVGIDLLSLRNNVKIPVKNRNIRLIDIYDHPFDKLDLIYPTKGTYLKYQIYVENGYEGLLAVIENEVIGHSWFSTSASSKSSMLHPDFKWLDFKIGEKDAYLFDIYVKSKMRGNNIGYLLLLDTLNVLKARGLSNSYAYVYADNIAQRRNLGKLRFSELKSFKMHRFFLMRRIKK